MQYLWGFLDGISLITVLSLISVSVPGLANEINMYLLNLAQLNLIPANELTDIVFNFDDYDDNPLNGNFNLVGFGETNSIRNLGSTFPYMIFLWLLSVLLLLLELCNNRRRNK